MKVRNRVAGWMLTSALALAACGAPTPPIKGFTQQEFFVASPSRVVYDRLEVRMENCKVTNSLFGRADLDATYESSNGHGRLIIVRDGRTLWGVELLAKDKGTHVLAFAARDVAGDHYEWLIRQWAQQTYKRSDFPDC